MEEVSDCSLVPGISPPIEMMRLVVETFHITQYASFDVTAASLRESIHSESYDNKNV